ncbi:MAG: hypothetical protein KGO02_18945 [Alphaproteobacteria bacterium]|nr:hypothetical protein [Alphaproteobacteria bacterium]
MALCQGVIAEAVRVQLEHFKGICNNHRNGTAATPLILARAIGNSPAY